MEDKILVTYGTWSGSTSKIAETIGETLRENGTDTDVIPAKEVNDLTPYKAVVLGTAIHAGLLHPEIQKFVDNNHEMLFQRPTAFFIVCLTMKEDTPESRSKTESYLDALREKYPDFNPVSVGLFAGAMNLKKLSFPFRLIMKAMKAEEGDYRVWEDIKSWAKSIQSNLITS